ncbi:MAG: hypothetical protein IPM13_18270 [Phycisphaerales bacterium]|nr:hypothetical protein [Phycisphaerales bacterium]
MKSGQLRVLHQGLAELSERLATWAVLQSVPDAGIRLFAYRVRGLVIHGSSEAELSVGREAAIDAVQDAILGVDTLEARFRMRFAWTVEKERRSPDGEFVRTEIVKLLRANGGGPMQVCVIKKRLIGMGVGDRTVESRLKAMVDAKVACRPIRGQIALRK